MIDLKQLNERIKQTLSPELRKMGFKGSGNHYRRINENGTINCIAIQKSRYGESYFVEIGAHYAFMPNMLNELMKPNKYTTYDCEFRRRISTSVGEHSWSYGRNEKESDMILKDVISQLGNIGEKYFDLFNEYPEPFTQFRIEDFVADREMLNIYGATTESRMALVLARIHTNLGDFEKADYWIEHGLNLSKGKGAFCELLEQLRRTRSV